MSLSEFLKQAYGAGATEKTIRAYLTKRNIAMAYGEYKSDSFKYSDDELASFYSENKDDYDYVNYRYFAIPFDIPEDADEDTKNQIVNEAKTKAEAMMNSVTDEASFITLAYENTPEEEKADFNEEDTYSKDLLKRFIDAELADWLYSADRKAGDKTVLQSEDHFTVLYMINRYRNEYNTVSVRHILIKTPAESETTDEAAAKAADDEAKKKAEDILAEWKSGEATEESFGGLANKYSEDPGSNTSGGLYSEFHKGQMYQVFEDWSYDSARKAGDTGIIKSSSGYHIMYYVGVGRPYWMVQAESTKRASDYDAFITAAKENYEVELNESAIGKISASPYTLANAASISYNTLPDTASTESPSGDDTADTSDNTEPGE